MIAYRNCDGRYPFLWEGSAQPAARWHPVGEGPVQYLADTPVGAWAEFLRHEDITDEDDLEGVQRALWAVEIGDPPTRAPSLPVTTSTGGRGTYPACQADGKRLRGAGVAGLVAKSAALKDGAAGGQRVEAGLRDGPAADGRVFVLFGARPDLLGWLIVDPGRPPAEALPAVRHFPKK